jgi:hypothetical protein
MQRAQAPRKQPKQFKQQKTAAKKVVRQQQKRKMTVFAGSKPGSEQVFATGQVKRVSGGKTTEFPMALELTATPALNTLAVTQHRFIQGSGLIDTYTEALLVNPKGDAATVRAMTVEPILKEGSAKLTGPSFAWTKAQLTSSGADGKKIETTFDFGKGKIGFNLKLTGKENFTETADFNVVEKAQFYDFIRVSKADHERMAVPAEDAAAV